MNFTDFIIKWLASHLKVPEDALQMLNAAHRLSGLNNQTLPAELVPLNTRQLARGLLNFTVLQSSPGWVLPYWAERQYDPVDAAFVPRSHFGLSINVTHRNWTAVGNPCCAIEPIVDPRGLVTPFPGGWSVDVFMKVADILFYPSRAPSAVQHLVDGLPIVETGFSVNGVTLTLRTLTSGKNLVHQARITNATRTRREVTVAFAVRPFNPEGISLLYDLEYRERDQAFVVGKDRVLKLSKVPGDVQLSLHDEGDCAAVFAAGGSVAQQKKVHCGVGLASGFARYNLDLGEGASELIECSCALEAGDGPSIPIEALDATRETWTNLLAEGTTMRLPDSRMNEIVRASLSTLLMFTEGGSITPGPATYHQFWFRDAAYMMLALNRFGFFRFTRPVIESFPSRQERSGYFRSQQGEWDSNGQVLWTALNYALLSGDVTLVPSIFPRLKRAVHWIERMRSTQSDRRGKSLRGLLPAGLSAEHLGLADHYFWDNFWSIAGIEAFSRICLLLGRHSDHVRAVAIADRYRKDAERSIRDIQQQYGMEEIPASPTRGIDHGMIGSICAWYPLQLYSPNDSRLSATLRTLTERYLLKGMFYQQFVHSGLNPYLTLQIAHCWLYAGYRRTFWQMLTTVLSRAFPTLNFPEAIHPRTGGGSMGDGHHGWAAAEVLLSLRDAMVFEQWHDHYQFHDLILLAGVPSEWFLPGVEFSLVHAPIVGGKMDMAVSTTSKGTAVTIAVEQRPGMESRRRLLELPFGADRLWINAREFPASKNNPERTAVELPVSERCLDIFVSRSGVGH